MNRGKWLQETDQYKLFCKLAEEVGEVGKALQEQGLDDIVEEIDHVVFIATQLRRSVTG